MKPRGSPRPLGSISITIAVQSFPVTGESLLMSHFVGRNSFKWEPASRSVRAIDSTSITVKTRSRPPQRKTALNERSNCEWKQFPMGRLRPIT